MRCTHTITVAILSIIGLLCAHAYAATSAEPPSPIRVFILAGQSNMEGHGQIASLPHLGEHPTHGQLLNDIRNPDGTWIIRDDVHITWNRALDSTDNSRMKRGPLTVGWGASERAIGPELLFGTVMGDHFDQPVVLIKVAWGGKDVYCDFRSPGAGPPTPGEALHIARQQANGQQRDTGHYYNLMIAQIKQQLADLSSIAPELDDRPYELAGMAWFQGWNDYCQWRAVIDDQPVGRTITERYGHNLAAMLKDLRNDLNAPDMPVVIGGMGIAGTSVEHRADNPNDHIAQSIMNFRAAQRSAAEDHGLKNVAFIPTAPYWDDRLEELQRMRDQYTQEKKRHNIANTPDNELPTPELTAEYRSLGGHWHCHYNGSATTYSLAGYAMAHAILSISESMKNPNDADEHTP